MRHERNLMRLAAVRLIAIATLTSTSPMALAQQAPLSTVSAGMQIVDMQGGVVGTVAAVSGDTLTVKTDRHEAQLNRAGFAGVSNSSHEGFRVKGLSR
jgi:preprotein translocase subunit YajC